MVILNPYWSVAQEYGLYQRDRFVGADLGDRDEGGLVAVHAGAPMYRGSSLHATLGTCFGDTIEEGRLTIEVLPMGLSTCKTEAIVGYQFEDLRRTQLAGAAGFGEGEMVVFKTHDRTQCTGLQITNLLRVRRTRRLRLGFGGFLSNHIDPNTRWREVEVVEIRSGSIILL